MALRAGILIGIVTVAAIFSAIPSLRRISMVVVVGASALLGWLSIRAARDTARQEQHANELRRLNETLEAQIEARTADLRDSHARLRSIIDSAVDGIIVIDEKGCIESFNPGAERLFGYTEGEMLGQKVNMLMPSPYHEEHDTYLSRYLATGRAKIIGTGREVTGRRRDGTAFPLHLSVGEVRWEANGSSPASCTISRRASASKSSFASGPPWPGLAKWRP